MQRFAALALIVLSALLGTNAVEAQNYRAIKPLVSTRADVEALLGTPDPDCDCYRLGQDMIRVTFSEGPESEWGPGRWNVPAGTVLEVEINYGREPRITSFPVDLERFDEYHGSCIPDAVTYDHEGEGLAFDVESGRVERERVYPTADQRRQFCSDPGDYVDGRPKRRHFSPGPPICLDVIADPKEAAAGESIQITARAADPSGRKLIFTWTATGGRIEGEGPTVTLDTSGLEPGYYTVAVQIDEGSGHIVDCAATVRVK